jgi:hypothetical protein
MAGEPAFLGDGARGARVRGGHDHHRPAGQRRAVRALKTFYDEAQIVETTAAVALENFRSKFNVPLGVEAQGFCVL